MESLGAGWDPEADDGFVTGCESASLSVAALSAAGGAVGGLLVRDVEGWWLGSLVVDDAGFG